ncbi:hypothetical protein ACRALDRAFT_207971 [Sodiomyces alcalophilus JCM 7366]|uniref:uncharacterized protein n=1 Tax=Sodiomyces alcalophilus JCM 7366 TaxID=591952 RepID=UPI0039B63827
MVDELPLHDRHMGMPSWGLMIKGRNAVVTGVWRINEEEVVKRRTSVWEGMRTIKYGSLILFIDSSSPWVICSTEESSEAAARIVSNYGPVRVSLWITVLHRPNPTFRALVDFRSCKLNSDNTLDYLLTIRNIYIQFSVMDGVNHMSTKGPTKKTWQVIAGTLPTLVVLCKRNLGLMRVSGHDFRISSTSKGRLTFTKPQTLHNGTRHGSRTLSCSDYNVCTSNDYQVRAKPTPSVSTLLRPSSNYIHYNLRPRHGKQALAPLNPVSRLTRRRITERATMDWKHGPEERPLVNCKTHTHPHKQNAYRLLVSSALGGNLLQTIASQTPTPSFRGFNRSVHNTLCTDGVQCPSTLYVNVCTIPRHSFPSLPCHFSPWINILAAVLCPWVTGRFSALSGGSAPDWTIGAIVEGSNKPLGGWFWRTHPFRFFFFFRDGNWLHCFKKKKTTDLVLKVGHRRCCTLYLMRDSGDNAGTSPL